MAPNQTFVVASRDQVRALRGGAGLRTSTAEYLRAPASAGPDLRAAILKVAPDADVASRAERIASIENSPLTRGLVAGVGAVDVRRPSPTRRSRSSAALALAGASRAIEVAHLRTLGLTRREALGLVIVEHGPTIIVAFVAGVLLGLGLFGVLRDGLGLASLVGAPIVVDVGIDPIQLGAVLLAIVTIVALGIGLGAALQRNAAPVAAVRRGFELMSQRHEPSAWSSERRPADRGAAVAVARRVARSRGRPAAAAATSTLPTGLSRQGRPRYGEGALIVCDNLVKIYKVADLEVVALQGLDLLVNDGEMIAIVGASGSGKSTLLNILGGLDVPSAGRAVVAGLRADLRSGRRERTRYRRRVVGFVWQQTARNLLPYLSAVENVELPMILDGRRKTRASGRRSCSTSSGCRDRLDHRPERLSGGEQQRVAIAVALANEPEVLLADEPTGELDTATSREVFALLRRVNERARDDDRHRHPRPARVRAGPADGRDPRRPDLHRDAPPDRAGRRRRPRRDQRGVRRPRPGRPAAAAEGSTSRRSGCSTGSGSASRTTTSGSGRTRTARRPAPARRHWRRLGTRHDR